MAFMKELLTHSFKNSDTEGIEKYTVCALDTTNAGGVVTLDGANAGAAIGVNRSSGLDSAGGHVTAAQPGQSCLVMLEGIAEVMVLDANAIGGIVYADMATGQGTNSSAAGANPKLGLALEASDAAGEIISVLLTLT